MAKRVKNIRIPSKYNEYETVTAEFLAAGTFSTCFVYNDTVYSFVKESGKEFDYSKEGIAEWADSDNPYIPDFNYIGDIDNTDGKIYTSPLYNKLTAKSKTAWNEAKELKRAWDTIGFGWEYRHLTGYEKNNKIIDLLRGKVNPVLIDALISINDSLANYGDYYYFEFPTRNLKVNDDGHLILLDVIFNSHALPGSNKS